ncbi:hypothetical protein T06_11925 [Trichinella sp. T6]|nr:hypothetical protein T06_11925 [Trichinella sp. T6]
MSFVKDGASSNDAALICEFNVSPSGCAHNRTEQNNSNTYILSTENSIAKLACSSVSSNCFWVNFCSSFCITCNSSRSWAWFTRSFRVSCS